MRKIFGAKAAALVLILGFSMCLTSKAAIVGRRKTSIRIPYLNIREVDQEGLFLLIFDVSGSMWTSEKNHLAEDFQNIYLYLSGRPWAVEHDVILFDEEARLRSEILKERQKEELKSEWSEEIWATKKNTDLKEAFERLNNYLGGVSDKSWVHFVMVSDFYDSFRDDKFANRKKRMDEIVTSLDKDHHWELRPDYFIFDSPDEGRQGYKQYIPPNSEDLQNIVNENEEISEDSLGDGYASVKRRFIEKVLQGLTGENELEWKQMKDISMDALEKCKDYFVYSDKKMDYPEAYSEDVVWDYALESGGYLYHINHITMKTLNLDRSINEYYILIMPHIEATMLYTMAGNEKNFQEGKVEIKLEIKNEDKALVRADYFDVYFTVNGDKGHGVKEVCRLKKKQNGYVGEIELKPETYNVLLRQENGEVFLDEIVEEEFIIEEKEEK